LEVPCSKVSAVRKCQWLQDKHMQPQRERKIQNRQSQIHYLKNLPWRYELSMMPTADSPPASSGTGWNPAEISGLLQWIVPFLSLYLPSPTPPLQPSQRPGSRWSFRDQLTLTRPSGRSFPPSRMATCPLSLFARRFELGWWIWNTDVASHGTFHGKGESRRCERKNLRRKS
jgi:hypothetical protein